MKNLSLKSCGAANEVHVCCVVLISILFICFLVLRLGWTPCPPPRAALRQLHQTPNPKRTRPLKRVPWRPAPNWLWWKNDRKKWTSKRKKTGVKSRLRFLLKKSQSHQLAQSGQLRPKQEVFPREWQNQGIFPRLKVAVHPIKPHQQNQRYIVWICCLI